VEYFNRYAVFRYSLLTIFTCHSRYAYIEIGIMAFSVSAKKTKKKRSLTDIVPQHYMANRTFQLPKTPGSCLKLEVSTFIYSGLANR